MKGKHFYDFCLIVCKYLYRKSPQCFETIATNKSEKFNVAFIFNQARVKLETNNKTPLKEKEKKTFSSQSYIPLLSIHLAHTTISTPQCLTKTKN